MKNISTETKQSIESYICYFQNTKFNVECGSLLDYNFIAQHLSDYPPSLVYLWSRVGFASFDKGGFRLVNPSENRPIIKICIKRSHVYNHDKFIVVGRTAFGELTAIGMNTASRLTIDTVNMIIYPFIKYEHNLSDTEFADSLMCRLWSDAEKSSFDISDEDGNMLFEQCYARFGKLEENEIYAFKKPLFKGGKKNLDNMHKIDVYVYFQNVVTLKKFSVVKDITAVIDQLSQQRDYRSKSGFRF